MIYWFRTSLSVLQSKHHQFLIFCHTWFHKTSISLSTSGGSGKQSHMSVQLWLDMTEQSIRSHQREQLRLRESRGMHQLIEYLH